MPIDLDSHDSDDTVDVQPGTNEAEALCFLYANSEYGFKPSEVRDHTTIPGNSVHKALSRLLDKDVIAKTDDGYYHSLDNTHLEQYAQSLQKGEKFDLDTGREEYPDGIEETTTGFPEDDEELEPGPKNTQPEDSVGPDSSS